MLDVIRTARNFYTTLATSWACILIASNSEFPVAEGIFKNNVFLYFLYLLNTLNDVVLIFICLRLSSEVQNMCVIIRSFYTKKTLVNLKSSIRHWMYNCAHSDTNLNCGFLDLDFSIIPLLFDMITLLVFTLIQNGRA